MFTISCQSISLYKKLTIPTIWKRKIWCLWTDSSALLGRRKTLHQEMFPQKKVHLPQVIHFSLKNCINITTNISVRLSVPYIFLVRGKFVLTNSSTPSMQPVRNLRQMPEFSSVFWFFFYRPGCTGYPAGRISGLNYIRYPARYGIWVMTARYPAG